MIFIHNVLHGSPPCTWGGLRNGIAEQTHLPSVSDVLPGPRPSVRLRAPLVLLGDGYGHESRICKHCIELETRTCAPCALLLGGRTLWGVGSAASVGANTGLESEFARAGSVCGAWRRPASASPAVTNVAGDPAELVMLRTRCPLSYSCQNSEVEL